MKLTPQTTRLLMQVAAVFVIGLLLALLYHLQGFQPNDANSITLAPFVAPQEAYRKPAPALQWEDANNRLHNLQELRGRVTLINIWAHSCEPCKAELPSLNQLYQRLGSADVVFMGLNADRDESEKKSALEFWQVENLGFETQILSEASTPPDALPVTYILDRNGELIFEHQGALDWSTPDAEEFMKKLLNPAADDPAETQDSE